ncbi:MAG: ATP synthase F1 subunit gamma [Solirubrobacteraceae bacterium]|nr:MAG: ATP synthase F1 subunit gamma [Solirubrobacterales bacterium]
MSQRDIKTKIESVRNIQKITRAMEMVSAARLRRAEQRIAALRPYAAAIRRMTRQAADAAEGLPRLSILAAREPKTIGIMFVTSDRGLAGAFNSQILRAGLRSAAEHEREGREVVVWGSGRRGVSSLAFRGREPARGYTGFTDRPSYADARQIAGDLIAAFTDEEVDRVEVIYNGYVSPLTQRVTQEVLLPLKEASVLGEDAEDDEDSEGQQSSDGAEHDKHALVEYEPDAGEILKRLVPDYVEISIYRALLESTASEHGARMTAMRSASENASELIDTYTLEMNRARQAEITQEIMEVVAGAEGLG